jgi:hypothetical protein
MNSKLIVLPLISAFVLFLPISKAMSQEMVVSSQFETYDAPTIGSTDKPLDPSKASSAFQAPTSQMLSTNVDTSLASIKSSQQTSMTSDVCTGEIGQSKGQDIAPVAPQNADYYVSLDYPPSMTCVPRSDTGMNPYFKY